MAHPTPEQIVRILRQADSEIGQDRPVEDFCRRKHISTATYYRWRNKYGGLNISEAKRLKALETENAKLKKLLAEATAQRGQRGIARVPGKKSLTAPERHALITAMLAKGLSARSACKLAGLSRGVATYALKQPEREAVQLKALRQAARKNPRYGYRRVAVKAGLGFGQAWRLWKQHGFRLAEQRRRRKREPTGSCERPHRAEFPAHVWTYDTRSVVDQLADGRMFKTLSVLDEFTRECHGILVATSIRAVEVTGYPGRLMRRHGAPRFLRSDNGGEFTAQLVQAWLEPRHTGSASIPPGQPWQTGFIESFHDRFRDICLEREWFQSLAEAQIMVEKWRKHYNTQRPHSSLGYQTPAVFAAGCHNQGAESLTSLGRREWAGHLACAWSRLLLRARPKGSRFGPAAHAPR